MSLDLFRLDGKVALVTGATHGLGMAMARGLGRAGATVVVNGPSSQDRVARAVAVYEADGSRAHGYLFDVTDPEAVRQSVERIEREVGPIDVLVNNAAVIERTPLLDMTVDAWKRVVETDLTGVFVMSQPVVRGMSERGGGKVINICSMMSELGRDSVGAYAAAKGGLKMLTQSMATEWARHNIQVNGIGPGYFATAQPAPIRTDGHPDDLAGAAVFLASAASDFVNGHVLYVDGGILATIGRPQEA